MGRACILQIAHPLPNATPPPLRATICGGKRSHNGGSTPPTQPSPPGLHATRSFIPRKGGAWGAGRGERCGWTPFLRPSSVGLPFEGVKGARTARVASALLPIRASPGRGCEHDPTRHPARPTPAPHLSQSTVHGTRKVGRRGRARGTHVGSCAHAMRGGACSPSAPPRFAYLRARPHCTRMGAWRKGEGHSRTQMEGGVLAAPAACPLPSSRSLLAPPVPCPIGASHSPHPVRAGREGAERGRWSTPRLCATLAWVSGTQGAGGCAARPRSRARLGRERAPVYA